MKKYEVVQRVALTAEKGSVVVLTDVQAAIIKNAIKEIPSKKNESKGFGDEE